MSRAIPKSGSRWARTALVMVLAGAMLAAQADQEGQRREGQRHGQPPGPAPKGQYWDGAHGHGHYYPAPGFALHAPPPNSRVLTWGGRPYAFHDGVWYAPGSGGYVVVRPPYGVVVPVLPLFATAVVLGGLTYMYCNNVYYR